MNQFSEMGIEPVTKSFVGKRIPIEEVFDQKIIIHDFKIIPSKYPDKGNGKCLFMQVTFEDKMRVVFTGSGISQDMIQRVDKTQFPFQTIIVDKNKHYKFT